MSHRYSNFYQEGPRLKNTYLHDSLMRSYLELTLPKEIFKAVDQDLASFGERCAGELLQLANQAEAQQPRHVPYDPWGKRIDHIEVSSAWNRLHNIAAEEGLIALGYERKFDHLSRVYQYAKLYLFHPSSAFVSCPLAMTDGAARTLELSGTPQLMDRAFHHLTSRSPKEFWTSGQWMTERTGGSDVSRTSTVAKKIGDGYSLYGDKWFTSATTAQMALGLAKIEGANDPRHGLSLFYIELRDRDQKLQNIQIQRLKDKLGTKALPTAELRLEGTPAFIVGAPGEGVKRVASMLNITRLHNSVCAVSTMARALQMAHDYAEKREAFGKKLVDQPLHRKTLSDLQVDFEAAFHLQFYLVNLLGKDEVGSATPEEKALLRVLTPVMKLWSAKQAIALVSEVIESFGGAGYIEDTGLPRLLRDVQVLSIWEGTTNVLSLDMLRAISKDDGLKAVFSVLEKANHPVVKEAIQNLKTYAAKLQESDGQTQQLMSREFAFDLARTFAAHLLCQFADQCEKNKTRPQSRKVADWYCRKTLVQGPSGLQYL